MIDQVEGQLSLFDLDISSSKTFLDCSVPVTEKTSKPSSRKSSASHNQTVPMCLCLTGGGDGRNPAASTMNWADGQLLGGYSIHSFGEQPCTMMREMSYNLEHRNGVSESHLSQILTDSAHPKYYLSSKACEGILRRAEKKGKPLPEILKQALMRQMNRGKDALSNSQN